MKKQFAFLTILLFSFNAKAYDMLRYKFSCDQINDDLTYQAVCIVGNKHTEECRGYYITTGFGQIPNQGRLVSNQPYFIKTPDQNISKYVDCRNFNAYAVESYQQNQVLYFNADIGDNRPYPVNKKTMYKKEGTLSIVLEDMAITNPALAEKTIDDLKQMVKKHTNAKVKDIKTDKSQVLIKNITLAEAMFLKYMYQPPNFKHIFTEKGKLGRQIFFY